MPLRDHFRPLLGNKRSWNGLHGGWPMVIVQHLIRTLPDGYFAAPTVHVGSFEVDIGTFSEESSDDIDPDQVFASQNGGRVATAAWAPPKPTLTLQKPRLSGDDEYEVRIYDEQNQSRLVAAIELISPSNKDRPENRGTFVTKVASLLKQGVCVSVVDVVTTRQFNLYSELLNFVEGDDPLLGDEPAPIYAVTLRCRREKPKLLMDTWYYPLQIGGPMPTIPIWLNGRQSIALDLEATYEDTCKALRIS